MYSRIQRTSNEAQALGSQATSMTFPDNTVLPDTTVKPAPSLLSHANTETKHGDIMRVIILTFNLGKV